MGSSDVGRRRARNEDSFVVLPDLGIAVVADGMGGHPGGDIASLVAARATAEALARSTTAHGSFGPGENATPGAREGAMRQSVLAAHEAVLARSRMEPSLAGMGTTATALILDEDGASYTLGNVGDSRIYRWRRGALEQLTRDDTWLEERIKAGQVRREEAKGHPEGHLLTQCLGLAQPPEPRVATGAMEPSDVFLLCSDGLVTNLSDAEIGRVLEDHWDGTEDGAARAVDDLIRAANAAGGVDNITVILVSTVPAERSRAPHQARAAVP